MTARLAAGAALLAIIVLIALAWSRSDGGSPATATASQAAGTAPISGSPTPVPPPPDLGPAPELVDLEGWRNTDGQSFAQVRGPVTVVQFWTFGCSNCKATLPHLQELYATYRDDGLEIIGVHAPEFSYERDAANIERALVDLGVTWPVALDSNLTNFRSWQGSPRYWPRTYVIDGADHIRFDHIGEGKYAELEATVRALLDEA